ncbi:MAG TPA: hypothetical protein VIM22_01075, partial [Solirubrobacteraceae bacterium]
MASERPATGPLRVLIAGGGIAAAELLLGLRRAAEERVSIELLAPNRELVYRPLAVTEPFGFGHAQRFDLDRIAAEHGARRRAAVLADVDSEGHEAVTAAGHRISYDVLAVTIGARPREAVAGALTLGGEAAFSAYRTLLEQLAPGQQLVFAVPAGATWALPLYELALMTSTWIAEHGLGEVALTIVTPEEAPLEVFGRRA